ncbi:MAG: tetratricopeptide repeat protein [Pseudonocardiaceae bacterium]
MAKKGSEGAVADFCAELKRLQQRSGLSPAALAREVGYSKAQLYEILSGRIIRPPDWDRFVEPLVRACTDNNERAVRAWRGRHDVIMGVWNESRRSNRQDDSPRSTEATPLVAAQLPPNVNGFTGRTKELAELDRLLAVAGEESTAVPIFAVSGTPGVGKTALALRWAHQIRDKFPDGQLYVNLRGYDSGPPVTPVQALEGFLHTLDVPAERIPATLEDRAGLYRSLLDKRRVLVVLDNADTTEQVRPLLPGSPGCLVVVTSRNRLGGLLARDGAQPVSLDPLPLTEAIVLLRQIIGTDRVEAETDVAAELAEQCACLPLALRIAAERVTSHPRRTLADLAGELADERDRLDVLAVDDDETTAVRSVFFWSYRALSAETARLFRLLGLHAGPDISVPAATALTGNTTTQTRRLLDALTGVHLLEESGRDRFRFHDLLRVYAAERAAAEEIDLDRDTTVRRLLAWYLHTADAAGRVLTPLWPNVPLDPPEADCLPLAFPTYSRALDWCEAERANLVAATRHAADWGQHVVAWKLPAVVWGFFSLRGHWADWIITHEIGLAATRHLHDRHGEAWIANSLGEAYRGHGQVEKSLDYLHQALAIWGEIHDRWGEGWTLYNLGVAYRGLGRLDEALDHHQRGLARGRELGWPWGAAWALHGLGSTYRDQGRFAEAFDHYDQALTVRREIDDRWGEGRTLRTVGNTYRSLGRFDEALNHYHQALIVYREIHDRWAEGRTLQNLGEVLHDTDQSTAARTFWHQALAIFEELGDPHAAEVRARIAALDTEEPDQNYPGAAPPK